MDIIKDFISTLYNSNIVIEFEDTTWMRVNEESGRYIWYNSVNCQRLYFHKDSECYKFIELSINKSKIQQIVYNSYHGNILLYNKEKNKTQLNEIEQNTAQLLLELNKSEASRLGNCVTF